MNSLKEVQEIIDEHITKVGQWMEEKGEQCLLTDDPNEIFKEAEQRVTEGLQKLNALKLSPYERQHFSLIRDGFKEFAKACKAGSKGKYEKADKIMEKAVWFAQEYLKRTEGMR